LYSPSVCTLPRPYFNMSAPRLLIHGDQISPTLLSRTFGSNLNLKQRFTPRQKIIEMFRNIYTIEESNCTPKTIFQNHMYRCKWFVFYQLNYIGSDPRKSFNKLFTSFPLRGVTLQGNGKGPLDDRPVRQ